MRHLSATALVAALALLRPATAQAADPLPSWNEGPARQSIVKFVADVTKEGGAGYKTYIVSGGGIEFMRPWTERVYGIPPEQVVGSSIKTRFEMRDDKPLLLRLPADRLH